MDKYPDKFKNPKMKGTRFGRVYAGPNRNIDAVYNGPEPEIEDVYNGPDPDIAPDIDDVAVEAVYNGPDPSMMEGVYAGPTMMMAYAGPSMGPVYAGPQMMNGMFSGMPGGYVDPPKEEPETPEPEAPEEPEEHSWLKDFFSGIFRSNK